MRAFTKQMLIAAALSGVALSVMMFASQAKAAGCDQYCFLSNASQVKAHVAARRHHHLSRVVTDANGNIVGHPAGCPWRLFCGCGASVRIFGHPVRSLFLAANWRRFPPAAPAPGMAAWRYGHVFVIEQVNGDGTVVAYDANSGGHQTRVHTVSLRGYHVVNPLAGRLANL